jgi:hypothetical protein
MDRIDNTIARPLEAIIHLFNFLSSIRHITRERPGFHTILSLMSLALFINAITTLLTLMNLCPVSIHIFTYSTCYVVCTMYVSLAAHRLRLFSFHLHNVNWIYISISASNILLNIICVGVRISSSINQQYKGLYLASRLLALASLFSLIVCQNLIKYLIGTAVFQSSSAILIHLPQRRVDRILSDMRSFYLLSAFTASVAFVMFTLRIFVQTSSQYFLVWTGILSYPIIGLTFSFEIIYHSFLTDFIRLKPFQWSENGLFGEIPDAMLEGSWKYNGNSF